MPIAGASPLFPLLGVDFTRVDDSQKHQLGIEVPASDGRRYTYIRAGAAIAVSDVLKVDVAEGPNDWDPTSAVDQSIAGVAHVAIADNKFGWVVSGGGVPAKAAATVVAGAPIGSTAVAGTVDDVVAAAGNALALAAGRGGIFTTITTSGIAQVYLF